MSQKSQVQDTFCPQDYAGIRKMARSLLGVAGILPDDLPDIEQELARYLILEQDKFDPSASSWSTFRWLILKHAAAGIVRRRVRPSARYETMASFSLNEEFSTGVGNAEEEVVTWGDMINQDGLFTDGTEKPEISNLDLQIDMKLFLQKLSPELQELCQVLQRNSISEVSRMLGLDRKTIQRRIQYIRRRMRAAQLNSYL